MQTTTMPRCPKCADGGDVTLVETDNDVSSVFQPLPKGDMGRGQSFQCECGWTLPAPGGDAEETNQSK